MPEAAENRHSGGSPPLYPLHQFDSISERIINVDSRISFQRPIVPNDVPHALEDRDKIRETFDEQSGMSLSSRDKIGFDAQVNLEITALEPAPAAPNQMRRFGDLRNPERVSIKFAGSTLTARRHGKLNMFQSSYQHGLIVGHADQKVNALRKVGTENSTGI
jgi:hypothetical protein